MEHIRQFTYKVASAARSAPALRMADKAAG